MAVQVKGVMHINLKILSYISGAADFLDFKLYLWWHKMTKYHCGNGLVQLCRMKMSVRHNNLSGYWCSLSYSNGRLMLCIGGEWKN